MGLKECRRFAWPKTSEEMTRQSYTPVNGPPMTPPPSPRTSPRAPEQEREQESWNSLFTYDPPWTYFWLRTPTPLSPPTTHCPPAPKKKRKRSAFSRLVEQQARNRVHQNSRYRARLNEARRQLFP